MITFSQKSSTLLKPVESVVRDFLRKLKSLFIPKHEIYWFSGNYNAWDAAISESQGYDDEIIFEKIKESALKVKSGEALFERDSIVFYKLELPWAVIAVLQKIYFNNKRINLIDFGGALGSSYFQFKHFLDYFEKINWSVIEQEHIVEFGRNNIANNQLYFFNKIGEISNLSEYNVFFSSCTFQYLENPFKLIESIIDSFNFENILLDRIAFIDDHEQRLAIQYTSEGIYKSSYPSWFFNEEKFVNRFANKYVLAADFPSYCDKDRLCEGKKIYWKGFYFVKKST